MSLDYKNIKITPEIFYSPEYTLYKEENLKNFYNCGVYVILNTENENIYIGSSRNIKNRFREHKNNLRNNKHCNSHLQNAWNKYGEKAFSFYIIEHHVCIENIVKRENKLIKLFNPAYNIIKVNDDSKFFHSVETRRIMSEKAKGRKLSEETKIKISLGGKGRKLSNDSKQKISIANKGKPHGVKGRKLSNEEVLKIVERNKLRLGELNPNSRKIINTDTNEVYNCIREAAEKNNIAKNTLSLKLCGIRKNNTNLKYYS